MHDLVIVSDLHLGRGKNPKTGRYYELEAFFYDEDFLRFCRYLCDDARRRQVPLKLVLNGDTFDLLRLDPVPLDGDPQVVNRFAPALNPTRAAAEVSRILGGHPALVEALATVLAEGHEVVVLPGNHDIEVQWEPVRDSMRRCIGEHPRLGDEPGGALERLRFEDWFYHEPGRIWVEHGCQYDPENAFRYPLRRELVHEPDALHEAELDNPLGNFFQRYLYNAFGHITFIVPSTRANTRYMKWLVFNDPQLLLRIVKSHWRFWWQVLRRVAKYPSRDRARLAQAHERQLERLARSSGLGDDLRQIDALKESRADITAALQSFSRQAWRLVWRLLGVGALVFGLWFFAIHGLTELRVGLWRKAAAFLGFGFFFLFSAFGAVLYSLFRGSPSVLPQPMRQAAAAIARRLDVPIVCFGHTHEEVLWRLKARRGRPGGAWYFNTGTWIAVFTHDVLLPRERVQYTFLRVRGHEGELMSWSPGRGEPKPVVLLDEAAERATPGETPS
ncbi:MAG: metallophosphoesterase [Myxococcales bacterium]|nr:metallophosphoesterase [Myxococcales bacterium]